MAWKELTSKNSVSSWSAMVIRKKPSILFHTARFPTTKVTLQELLFISRCRGTVEAFPGANCQFDFHARVGKRFVVHQRRPHHTDSRKHWPMSDAAACYPAARWRDRSRITLAWSRST